MEKVKQTDDYVIYQKRSKRYAIKDSNHKWVRGDEKIKILLDQKLIKAAAPKPKKEEPAEQEASAEAKTEETTEAPAEEVKAEKTEQKVEEKTEEKAE